MAINVIRGTDGTITYQCESVEEAVALGRAMGATAKTVDDPGAPVDVPAVFSSMVPPGKEETPPQAQRTTKGFSGDAPAPLAPHPPKPASTAPEPTVTLGELARRMKLARASGPKPSATSEAAAVLSKAETWRQPLALDVYWGRLDAHGRAAIRLIAQHDGTSIEDLRVALKLPTTRHVSQVLSACKRTAIAVGIADYRDIFTYTISGARDNRVSLYHAGPLLRGEGP